jgi:tetratricopeptide (TPR) repeat protein
MSAEASRARDLLLARRPGEAVKALLEGLSSSPDDPELHCLLAQAHLILQRPKECLKAATDAVRVAPDMEWAHRLRSIALRQMRRNRESIEAAAQAVRLEPSLSAAQQTLADAHLAASHSNEAYGIALEALRLEPDSPDVHDLIGRCLLSMHRYAEAERAFRNALQLDPNDSTSHNNLGVALQAQGRRVDAVHAFNAAAKIDPTDETARKNVYSGTQTLIGGGIVAIAVISLIRLSVLLNSSRHPSLVTVLIAAVLIAGIVVFLIRHRRVSKDQLPTSAVAYYEAESRRLRAERRPIQLLRVGSILFAGAMTVLGIALASGLLLLLTIPVAALWYAFSPAIWRWIMRRFVARGDAA